MSKPHEALTRFNMDMDGSMEPDENGRWVRADKAVAELRRLHQVELQRDELLKALEDLIAWQVKNVKVWHNSAYDRAHDAINKVKGQS